MGSSGPGVGARREALRPVSAAVCCQGGESLSSTVQGAWVLLDVAVGNGSAVNRTWAETPALLDACLVWAIVAVGAAKHFSDPVLFAPVPSNLPAASRLSSVPLPSAEYGSSVPLLVEHLLKLFRGRPAIPPSRIAARRNVALAGSAAAANACRDPRWCSKGHRFWAPDRAPWEGRRLHREARLESAGGPILGELLVSVRFM